MNPAHKHCGGLRKGLAGLSTAAWLAFLATSAPASVSAAPVSKIAEVATALGSEQANHSQLTARDIPHSHFEITKKRSVEDDDVPVPGAGHDHIDDVASSKFVVRGDEHEELNRPLEKRDDHEPEGDEHILTPHKRETTEDGNSKNVSPVDPLADDQEIHIKLSKRDPMMDALKITRTGTRARDHIENEARKGYRKGRKEGGSGVETGAKMLAFGARAGAGNPLMGAGVAALHGANDPAVAGAATRGVHAWTEGDPSKKKKKSKSSSRGDRGGPDDLVRVRRKDRAGTARDELPPPRRRTKAIEPARGSGRKDRSPVFRDPPREPRRSSRKSHGSRREGRRRDEWK